MHVLDRRSFLRQSAVATGALMGTGAALERLNLAYAAETRTDVADDCDSDGYGPLERKAPENAPGRFVLALPKDFTYVTFGEIGSAMADGNPTPIALDGMAAFTGPGGTVRLIRNHEDRNGAGKGTLTGPDRTRYDLLAGGGTTTLDYDPKTRRLVRDFISLNGTTVNCAGGVGLGGRSWITCEETVDGPAQGYERKHGYCYEVRRKAMAPEPALPITAMGRFSHEAVAVDPRTGIVYLTEDPSTGRGAGFYRYIPDDRNHLIDGGKLQMLGVRGQPQYDSREGQRRGRRLSVRWFDIAQPDPELASLDDPNGVFLQGFAAGGAKFNRLEGCWYDAGSRSIFFVSTSGGDAKNGDVNRDGFQEGFGQVWEYLPRHHHHRDGGGLRLAFESPASALLDSPDNITVTPRGGLIMCEDDAGGFGDTHPLADGIEDVNRLVGLTRCGQTFEFAVNVLNDSELAGVCFSPDGQTLFVNILGHAETELGANTGMTCAVTGPWRRGPL